ncbi:hypothetical protein E0L36_17755 [Streptomyces sp. AJS327]|uniref:hypothetical protein n=1 Tax=Streptomyces sp. AJS327 TaxID=2545265 RepID=UPI0015DE359F|nr:hypothetical protein [Streptomyces sp. AJS327]MBA0052662.1 hypothetical protein [Streptomyces sp. AJS327]
MSRIPQIPVNPMYVPITPDMAKAWLEHCNPESNRVLSEVVCERYAKTMRKGEWKTTHQAIAFDSKGKLLDGQHRLNAIATSGVTVTMLVIPNCDPATFDVLDAGHRRQASQLVKIPHRIIVTAAARMLGVMYGMWEPVKLHEGFYDTQATTPDILRAVAAWPELGQHAPTASTVYRATRINQPTHLVVLAQAERSAYAHRIEEWKNGLTSGANMEPKDPRLLLRNRFVRDFTFLASSGGRKASYNLIAKAWNAWVLGKGMGTLKYSDSDGVVKIAGLENGPLELFQ